MDWRYYYLDPTSTYTEEQISENVKNQTQQMTLIQDLVILKTNNPSIDFNLDYQWNTKSNEELQELYNTLKQSLITE